MTAKTEGKEVTLVVIDTETNRPVPGAKVEVSELRNRLNFTTPADGTFKVPVEKKYVDENSIIVVTLPPNVTSYRVEVARPPPPPPPPPAPTMPEPTPAAEQTADAGV
ncbi:MAG: hypothetical protein QM817_24555 [Archangium sp.]